MDELVRQLILRQTRRSFLGNTARGIGSIALASLVGSSARAGGPATTQATSRAAIAHAPDHWPGAIKPLHFPAKAKRVIHLYMAGGPTHLDTFDYKPKLREM